MQKQNFINLVKSRRSIRRFRNEEVPNELLKRCVEAARYAPSSCHTQSWRFVVLRGELKDRVVSEVLGGMIVPNRWAKTAPVIVVLAVDMDLVTHFIGARVKGIDYHLLDAGIAGEHFVLQAAELGLGTCWIGWFDKKKLKKIAGIPRKWDVAAMIAIGYPDEVPKEKHRKALNEILIFKE